MATAKIHCVSGKIFEMECENRVLDILLSRLSRWNKRKGFTRLGNSSINPAYVISGERIDDDR